MKKIIPECITAILIYSLYNTFKGIRIHGNMKNTLEAYY